MNKLISAPRENFHMIKLAKDKRGHFIVGFLVGIVSLGNLPLSIMAVQAGAIGKEVYDYLNPKNHTCDPMDYMATAAGGFASISIIEIAKFLV